MTGRPDYTRGRAVFIRPEPTPLVEPIDMRLIRWAIFLTVVGFGLFIARPMLEAGPQLVAAACFLAAGIYCAARAVEL